MKKASSSDEIQEALEKTMLSAGRDARAFVDACEILAVAMRAIRVQLKTTATEDRDLALWEIGQLSSVALDAAAKVLKGETVGKSSGRDDAE